MFRTFTFAALFCLSIIQGFGSKVTLTGRSAHLRGANDQKGIKVYVYSLPAYLSRDIYAEFPSCRTSMFGTDHHLSNLMLKHNVRTLDPEEADFFYVTINQDCWMDGPFAPGPNLNKARQTFLDAVYTLNATSKYFSERPQDHVFTFSHDYGPCFTYLDDMRAFYKDIVEMVNVSIKLQNFGTEDSHPCYDPDNTIVIPPNVVPFTKTIVPEPDSTPRTILASMAGRAEWLTDRSQALGVLYSNGARQSVLDVYGKGQFTKDEIQIITDRMSFSDYMTLMKSSTFCLCVRGWAPWSPRIVESLLAGCIPVLVADKMVMPFADLINWHDISVRIPEETMKSGKMIDILKTYASSPQVIKTMQAKIRLSVSALVFAQAAKGAPMATAADSIVASLMKLKATRATALLASMTTTSPPTTTSAAWTTSTSSLQSTSPLAWLNESVAEQWMLNKPSLVLNQFQSNESVPNNEDAEGLYKTCPLEGFDRALQKFIDQGLFSETDVVGARSRFNMFATWTTCGPLGPKWPISQKKMIINLAEGTTGTRWLEEVMIALGYRVWHYPDIFEGMIKQYGNSDWDAYDFITDSPVSYQVYELVKSHPNAVFLLSMREPLAWQSARLMHNQGSWEQAVPCGAAGYGVEHNQGPATLVAQAAWSSCLVSTLYNEDRLFAFNLWMETDPKYYISRLMAWLTKHGLGKPSWDVVPDVLMVKDGNDLRPGNKTHKPKQPLQKKPASWSKPHDGIILADASPHRATMQAQTSRQAFNCETDYLLLYSQVKTGLEFKSGFPSVCNGLPITRIEKEHPNQDYPRFTQAHFHEVAIDFLSKVPASARVWVVTITRNPLCRWTYAAQQTFSMKDLAHLRSYVDSICEFGDLGFASNQDIAFGTHDTGTMLDVEPFFDKFAGTTGVDLLSYDFPYDQKRLLIEPLADQRKFLVLRHEDRPSWEEALAPIFPGFRLPGDSDADKEDALCARFQWTEEEAACMAKVSEFHFYSPDEVSNMLPEGTDCPGVGPA